MAATPTIPYKRRLADRVLSEALTHSPAILINGPRACGKTTTAMRPAAQVVRLDQPAAAGAFKADPDAALRERPLPLLLDEWQEVPEVLGAVKRVVDADPTPGQFILTGSVRADLEKKMWPGTGRLLRMSMYPLTQLELRGDADPFRLGFLERAQRCEPAAFALPPVDDRPDLREYVEFALNGGFPGVALAPVPVPANQWMDSYLDQLLTLDSHTMESSRTRDPAKLSRYFYVLAASSAGMPEQKTLSDTAGIKSETAAAYDTLLERLFVTEQVRAWSDNRLTRVTRTAKRYVCDPALMAAALDASVDTVLADNDLLGRLVDTFVMSQLRPEIGLSGKRTGFFHLRTKGGREEVDLIVELPGRKVIAIEIKSSASPDSSDAKHLRWLREQIGARFVVGIVFHTGPDVFELSESILAVPICALWG
jgi:hypothetical protein